MRYCPSASVTADRTRSMRSGLEASTVTPGSTPPELSRTTPLMDAWANADDEDRTSRVTAMASHTLRMGAPFTKRRSKRPADSTGREEKTHASFEVGRGPAAE